MILKHVIRTIVNSRAYQAGIETNEWNETDETNFSHFIPRRLPAESFARRSDGRNRVEA